jgi:hypothetical protein
MMPRGEEANMECIARILRHGRSRLSRDPRSCGSRQDPRRPDRDCASPLRPAFARMQLPLSTVRRLGAQCFLCQGIGCRECANTGLR